MTLDEFINSVRREVAKRLDLKTDAEIDAFFIGIEESAKDNQEALEKRDKMLRDTVEELDKAKRLLKAAVEDMKDIVSSDSGCRCCKGEQAASCAYIKCWTWRYTDEALALIGEEGGNNA